MRNVSEGSSFRDPLAFTEMWHFLTANGFRIYSHIAEGLILGNTIEIILRFVRWDRTWGVISKNEILSSRFALCWQIRHALMLYDLLFMTRHQTGLHNEWYGKWETRQKSNSIRTWNIMRRDLLQDEKLFLCIIRHYTIKKSGAGNISPCILDVGTWWRRIMSFTSLPHCPVLKSFLYLFNKMLNGPWIFFRFGGRENYCPLQELNPNHSVIQPVT
jgi:hypothetical protein